MRWASLQNNVIYRFSFFEYYTLEFMLKSTTEIRVRYADTDQMQIVYNGKYFEYFEVGRTEMTRELGLSYKDFEDVGFQLPVIETWVKYYKPARYDDILIIESRMEKLPTVRMRIDYEVRNKENGEILASGYTEHAFMDTKNNRITRAPAVFLNSVKPSFEK